MKYWKQGFYETPIEGAIEITNERFEELIDGQNAGKMITEDEPRPPRSDRMCRNIPGYDL